MSKLHLVSRRSFLKGLGAAGGMLAALPFLQVVDQAVEIARPVPLFNPSEKSVELIHNAPMEVTTIDGDTGEMQTEEIKSVSQFEESVIREALERRGYGLFAFDEMGGGYSIAFRYLTPVVPNASLNYMRAGSFIELFKGIEQQLNTMKPLTPVQLEKSRRKIYGADYEQLFGEDNLTWLKSFPVSTGRDGSITWRGNSVEQQIGLAGMRGLAPMTPTLKGLLGRETTGFAEGRGVPNSNSPEFEAYNREERRLYDLQLSALRKISNRNEAGLTSDELGAIKLVNSLERRVQGMWEFGTVSA